MEGLPDKLVDVVRFLLPGFLTAWVFFGLTAHRKNTQFERTIEALIFTAIVQPLVAATKRILFWLGSRYSFGVWTDDVALGWALAIGALLGLVLSVFANTDWVHWLLRKCRISTKTSYPSEWFRAFKDNNRWVVLHLVGPHQRRLYGWADEWPDQSDSGHFVILQPHWLLIDQCVPVHRVEKMLVPVTEVEMVEFIQPTTEIAATPDCVAETEKVLLESRRKEEEEDAQRK